MQDNLIFIWMIVSKQTIKIWINFDTTLLKQIQQKKNIFFTKLEYNFNRKKNNRYTRNCS